MKHKLVISDLSSIDDVARQFLSEIAQNSVVVFYAQMGAGKTTFISSLCKVLQVVDDVCSPTFTLVNEYCTQDGSTIYHFDLYRLKSISEAFDIGFEDYLYSGNLCLIEWPEIIESYLPEDCIKVHITTLDDNSRLLEW